jgi:hypothetical protein
LPREEADLRFLKIAFWVSLAIWLGGGLLTMDYAGPSKRLDLLAHGISDHDVTMLNLRGISINLFGPLTIVLGLLLAGAWLYKRSSRSVPAIDQPNERLAPSELSMEKRSPPPDSPHPTESATVSCTFSGWARDKNRIVQEYTYRGQGLNQGATVELTVEQGAIAILRFVHIWLSPATGDEGLGEIRLTVEDSQESSGWLPSQISTAAGNMTLMDVRTREGADAVWRLFSAGRDLDFVARLNGETLMSLPMPNNLGVQQHYEAIVQNLKR